jgi:hypothetical protein
LNEQQVAAIRHVLSSSDRPGDLNRRPAPASCR